MKTSFAFWYISGYKHPVQYNVIQCVHFPAMCLDVLRYRHVLSNGRFFDMFHAFDTSNERPWKVLSRHCPALAKGCMEFMDVVGIMFSRQVTHTAYVSIIYTTIYVDVTCTHSSTWHIHSSLCIFDMCIYLNYQALTYSILRYHLSYLCISHLFKKERDLHRLRYWLATSAYMHAYVVCLFTTPMGEVCR